MLCDWPFLFVECADLSALWSVATCRDHILVNSLFKNAASSRRKLKRRQVAALQIVL